MGAACGACAATNDDAAARHVASVANAAARQHEIQGSPAVYVTIKPINPSVHPDPSPIIAKLFTGMTVAEAQAQRMNSEPFRWVPSGRAWHVVWTHELAVAGPSMPPMHITDKLFDHHIVDNSVITETVELVCAREVIAAGIDFNAVIDKEGQLYTWGQGTFGQLGHGAEATALLKPQVVRGPLIRKRIYQVSAGSAHTGCVTDDWELFTWGFGDLGQLGHGDYECQSVPKKLVIRESKEEAAAKGLLREPFEIRQVSMGTNHSACVTKVN